MRKGEIFMKKVYLVQAEKCNYDQFDGVVVIADDEQEALELCKNNYYGGSFFEEDQGKITIKEIDLKSSTSSVILTSFNAG